MTSGVNMMTPAGDTKGDEESTGSVCNCYGMRLAVIPVITASYGVMHEASNSCPAIRPRTEYETTASSGHWPDLLIIDSIADVGGNKRRRILLWYFRHIIIICSASKQSEHRAAFE